VGEATQPDEAAANFRLAVYGTLAPGRSNHEQLAGLKGNWTTGTVKGRLFASGWGAALGFPGLVLDADGPLVQVQVFESKELPDNWTRLDNFEGEGYKRALVNVSTADAPVNAWIYVLAENPGLEDG
jgi:gamma-glutamylcyclotransferase (GGCT)/AIG2-like uncharacterized protein YtfP